MILILSNLIGIAKQPNSQTPTDIPRQKEFLYSVSQGHQQQPWHFSQLLHRQVVLHPYQQKPRPQRYNHVKQHYDLLSENYNINFPLKVEHSTILNHDKNVTHRQ